MVPHIDLHFLGLSNPFANWFYLHEAYPTVTLVKLFEVSEAIPLSCFINETDWVLSSDIFALYL